MKITIKTLKGEHLVIEVENSTTTLDLKKKIQEIKGFEPEQQKVIFRGQKLEDPATLEQSNVKDGDFMVLMVSQKKNAEQQPVQQQQPVTQATTQQQQQQQPQQPKPQTQPTQAQQNQPTTATSDSTMVYGEEYNKTVDEICKMGFSKSDVQEAMKAAYNNPDRAIDYLLNGIPKQTQPQPQQGQGLGQGQGAHGNVGENPLAALAQNPMFQQLRIAIQQNPALLGQVLGQIAQTNPQLYQLISQNQEAFLQLLMGGGEIGNPQPGVIQVTLEEKEAIDRIASMGFDKRDAIEAYLACDKNEEFALNYLLERQSEGNLLSVHEDIEADEVEIQAAQQGQAQGQQPAQQEQQGQQPAQQEQQEQQPAQQEQQPAQQPQQGQQQPQQPQQGNQNQGNQDSQNNNKNSDGNNNQQGKNNDDDDNIFS